MVLISAGIMSVSLLRKNEPFFNIHEIVQEYRKLIRGSTIVFFILPLLFSVGLALLYTAGTRFYSEIGVILGIILSMLLASLSILCNYDFSEVRDEQQRKKGRDVVKTTINVVFFDVNRRSGHYNMHLPHSFPMRLEHFQTHRTLPIFQLP